MIMSWNRSIRRRRWSWWRGRRGHFERIVVRVEMPCFLLSPGFSTKLVKFCKPSGRLEVVRGGTCESKIQNCCSFVGLLPILESSKFRLISIYFWPSPRIVMPLNGGAIAAALAKKREKAEGSDDSDSDNSIEELILEPVVGKKMETEASKGYIGIMGKRVPTPRTPPMASATVSAASRPGVPHHNALHPKHHFVLEQIRLASGVTTQRKSEYSDLSCFLFYIAIFLVIVIMQSDASSTYTITSTHSEFLFSEATDTVAFSDGRVVDRIPSLQKMTFTLNIHAPSNIPYET